MSEEEFRKKLNYLVDHRRPSELARYRCVCGIEPRKHLTPGDGWTRKLTDAGYQYYCPRCTIGTATEKLARDLLEALVGILPPRPVGCTHGSREQPCCGPCNRINRAYSVVERAQQEFNIAIKEHDG